MTKDLIVGLFFLAGIALAVVLTMSVSSFSLAESRALEINFADVSGLKSGDQVRVAGVNIGEVQEISAPDTTTGKVRVKFKMKEWYQLTENASFQVRSASALGGNYVAFVPGSGRELNDGEFANIIGTGSEGAFATLETILNENRGALREILAGLSKAIDDVNSGSGLLGTLINDPEFRSRFVNMASDLEEILEKTNNGSGPISKILSDEQLANSLDRIPNILADIEQVTRDISEGRGTLGALIRDDELLGHVRNAVENIDATFVSIREGDGLIADLLEDDAFAQDIKDMATNFSEVSEKINKGPGTISRLINEGDLLDDASGTLLLLRDVTEDAREQAPVNAFLNAIFGFF